MSGGALAETLLRLIDLESPSHQEAAITDWIAAQAGEAGMSIHARAADWAVFGPPRRGRPLILLAGHSDTVPAQDNLPGRIEDGWVHGLGASDMKAALAVMLELARRLRAEGTELAADLAFLVFGHEELAMQESLIPSVLAACPLVREAALAVMMEPTDNQLQAGCLGNLQARLEFAGVAAHSARPWLGRNAIHEAIRGLAPLAAVEAVEVEIEGLTFREVLNVTTIAGGVANNVIPDLVRCGLNYRYAPDKTPEQAESRLRELAGAAGSLTVVSNAPGAPVALANRWLRDLQRAGDLKVEPKQAWTPVAEFAMAGLDAVNFGPGDPAFAHKRDERVAVAAMERSLAILERWLRT